MSVNDEFRRVQRQLSTIFLILLVAGAASTFVSKWLPVFAVIFYATIGWFLTKSQKNSERFADSLYYLGFLLTLFSLFAATLNEAEATSAIISNLGTGLSTTLAGLALRVTVLQFRDTVSDQEEEARESLDLAVQSLLALFQTLNERVAALAHSLESETTRSTAAIQALISSAEAVKVDVARVPVQVASIIVPAAEELAQRIRTVNVPPGLFVEHAENLFSGLSQGIASAQRLIEQAAARLTKQLQETSQRSVSAGAAAEQGLAVLANSIAAVQVEASKAMSMLTDGVRSMTNEMQSKIDRVNLTPLSELNGEIQRLVHATAKNVDALGAATGYLQVAYAEQAKLANDFRASVQGSVEVVEKLKHAADSVVSIERVCEALQLRVESLDGAVTGVGNSSGMLIKTVEEVAKDVGEVKSAATALVSFVNQRQ